MSFITARTRIGALVMLVHDFSDISLEVRLVVFKHQSILLCDVAMLLTTPNIIRIWDIAQSNLLLTDMFTWEIGM